MKITPRETFDFIVNLTDDTLYKIITVVENSKDQQGVNLFNMCYRIMYLRAIGDIDFPKCDFLGIGTEE